jgi:hypothetical protein
MEIRAWIKWIEGYLNSIDPIKLDLGLLMSKPDK